MDSSGGLAVQSNTIKTMAGNEKHHKALRWIAGAIKRKGALHQKLGVPQGQKIPEGKLEAAAGKGGTLGKEARLAETLKGLHH